MTELPVFPLGTVLFPKMVLPLHVFEPRYRALMERVVPAAQPFGVVLIRRGHEVGGGEERFDVGTLARVVRAEPLDDGRWAVVILGERRFVVQRWLPDAPYPRAEVIEAPDQHDDDAVGARHHHLETRLRHLLELQQQVGDPGLPPDVALVSDPREVCWQDPAVSPLTALDRQRLLETRDCASRLDLLDELLVGVEEALTFRLLADG